MARGAKIKWRGSAVALKRWRENVAQKTARWCSGAKISKWRTSRWHELKKWLAPSSGEGRHNEEERIRRRSESVSDMGKKKLKSTGKGRHKEEER